MSRKFVYYGAGKAGGSLLLDSYPATAGYSLRKLRTSYTGPAIRVRRSSDNAEQDIGFVGNDLDTTSLLSFVGAGNGFVTIWYDQQGSNNFTQTAASRQPIIVNAGALFLENGKASISFQQDFMNSSLTLGSTTSYFNVFASKSGAIPFDGDVADRQIPVFIGASAYGIFQGSSIILSSVAPTTLQTLHTTIFDTLDNYYINGVNELTNENSGSDVLTGATIGANFIQTGFTDINYQELIVYNSNKSADRTAIENNINAYYGIY